MAGAPPGNVNAVANAGGNPDKRRPNQLTGLTSAEAKLHYVERRDGPDTVWDCKHCDPKHTITSEPGLHKHIQKKHRQLMQVDRSATTTEAGEVTVEGTRDIRTVIAGQLDTQEGQKNRIAFFFAKKGCPFA